MTLTSAVTAPSENSDRTQSSHPVVEIFGPTLQGEGPDMGRPAYFVRFGGCDFRCTWCDSMYAVEPSEVRLATRLTAPQIIDEIKALPGGPALVVLTGGNPALHDLGSLTQMLQADCFRVAVETQGSRWKPWLAEADQVVVSPKGPSSGMDSQEHRALLERFMQHASETQARLTLKPVIFDVSDLEYARWLAATWPQIPLHLSTGTDVGLDDSETVRLMLERLRWLSETVAADPALHHAKVGAQQHVLTWGTRRGV